MYDRYAEVYDRSGQIQFSFRMIPYLAELLARHGWKGQRICDLACGTGTLAIALARPSGSDDTSRLRVYGVDASGAMLKQARAKAAEAGVSVSWHQQDMRDFTLPEPVDLVTCCYDSLNYLLSVDDLTKTFRHVALALDTGGLFAFDVNTTWLYENLHAGGTFFSETDGLAIVIQGTYDAEKRLAIADIVGFVRRGSAGCHSYQDASPTGEKPSSSAQENLYERFKETHPQRAFTDEEIASALAAAGLREEARYHCFDFKPPGPETPKVMWVARKFYGQAH